MNGDLKTGWLPAMTLRRLENMPSSVIAMAVANQLVPIGICPHNKS